MLKMLALGFEVPHVPESILRCSIGAGCCCFDKVFEQHAADRVMALGTSRAIYPTHDSATMQKQGRLSEINHPSS